MYLIHALPLAVLMFGFYTQSSYSLCPNKIYPAHIPGDDSTFATVEVVTEMRRVQIIKYTRGLEPGSEIDGEVSNQAYETWESYLRENGFVILPIIERGGACILLKNGPLAGKIGVLLKYHGTRSQLCPYTGCYQALVSSDNTVAQVCVKETLETLVAVGTRVLLRLDDYAPSKSGCFVLARLNAPNVPDPIQGKAYVTFTCKAAINGTAHDPRKSMTIAVNPWDLVHEESRDWCSGASVHEWLDTSVLI